MVLKLIVFFIVVLCCGQAGAQAGLNEMEARWLRAGAPVLAYARQIGLPLDIIVQPQASPDAVPLAMGFSDGRCKLVLSMRANARAEAVLEPVPAARRALMIEAMTAHEIGHCWRYAQGAWHVLPSGFVGGDEAGERQALRETRREEAYADLAALAWTRLHHAGDYAEVHAWIAQLRREPPQAGGSHDTTAWLALARDGAVFAAGDMPFTLAEPVWSEGLRLDK